MARLVLKNSFAKFIQFRSFSYHIEFDTKAELPKLEEPTFTNVNISGSEHSDMLEVMYIMDEYEHD